MQYSVILRWICTLSQNSNITVMVTGLTKYQANNVLKNILVNFVNEQFKFNQEESSEQVGIVIYKLALIY